MKEDKAKTKWCPHSRASALEECTMGVTTYNYNRAGTAELPDDCMCIASGCMAWKWERTPQQAADINARGNAGAVEDGYCGLTK